jgi:NADPH:quinone reductase-like Zn-dependent oxidoreductase
MKAIRCREWGAAGVNFADSLMVGGTYQVKPPFPFTPGLEATGEIVETGSAVDGLQAKQRVLAGCCATAMAMPRKSCSMPPQWCRSRPRWISSLPQEHKLSAPGSVAAQDRRIDMAQNVTRAGDGHGLRG